MQRDQAHRTNELLERIAKALEKNTANVVYNGELKNTKDIPGFEGTLEALENLTNMTEARDYYKEKYESNKELHEEDDTIHNDYLNEIVQDMNQIEYSNFHRDLSLSFAQNDAVSMTNFIYELEYEECLGAIKTALLITGDSDYVKAVECSGFDMERKDELARNYVIDCIDGYDNLNTPTSDNPDPAGYGNCNDCNNENQYGKVDKCVCQDDGGDGYYTTDKEGKTINDPDYKKDPYTYDNNLREYLEGVVNDSDHDIRSTAKMYEDNDLAYGTTKKDCILDYVTNEFGSHGARYTDIIKFAYYLGAHNSPKYSNSNRGYYSCALNVRLNGHLIQGGKDCLVKGINKEGKERYFTLSFVESATDYWKRIS